MRPLLPRVTESLWARVRPAEPAAWASARLAAPGVHAVDARVRRGRVCGVFQSKCPARPVARPESRASVLPRRLGSALVTRPGLHHQKAESSIHEMHGCLDHGRMRRWVSAKPKIQEAWDEEEGWVVWTEQRTRSVRDGTQKDAGERRGGEKQTGEDARRLGDRRQRYQRRADSRTHSSARGFTFLPLRFGPNLFASRLIAICKSGLLFSEVRRRLFLSPIKHKPCASSVARYSVCARRGPIDQLTGIGETLGTRGTPRSGGGNIKALSREATVRRRERRETRHASGRRTTSLVGRGDGGSREVCLVVYMRTASSCMLT